MVSVGTGHQEEEIGCFAEKVKGDGVGEWFALLRELLLKGWG